MVVKKTDNDALNWDALNWELAEDETNLRLGPDSSAMVDYLLNPPPGYLVPGEKSVWGEATRERVMAGRRAAFEALIEAAFQTDEDPQSPASGIAQATAS